MSSPPATPPAQVPSCQREERFQETGDPCEWSEDYRPGGFHPIHLGDTFKDGQYRMLRKLGYGSFSTVWLVRDTKNVRYAAMKVMMSKHSSADTELEICNRLTKEAPSNTSRLTDHIVMLLDNFKHVGPNGTHLCLIYPPMGGTVASMVEKQHVGVYKRATPKYPMWMAKRILKHALSALAFLHQNDIVHGDVQPGNLLFSASNLDSLEEEELKQPESQITGPLQRLDGKVDRWAPKHLMLGQPLHEYTDLGPEMSIKISDFGAAFWSTNPPAKTVTPIALRAPEAIFKEAISSAIDIWSLGCLIYELLTGLQLFGVWMMGDDSQEEADDDHLLEFNDILGPLPDSWMEKWPRSHLWLGPNRERLNPRTEEDDKYDAYFKELTEDEQQRQDDEDREEVDSDGGSGSEDNDVTPDDDIPPKGIIDDNQPLPSQEEPYINVPLETLFEKNKPVDMPASEARVVTSLIRRILRYEASERPSARELLEDEWFK